MDSPLRPLLNETADFQKKMISMSRLVYSELSETIHKYSNWDTADPKRTWEDLQYMRTIMCALYRIPPIIFLGIYKKVESMGRRKD